MTENSIKSEQFESYSEDETKEIAAKVANNLSESKILPICLKGNLGSGKTVFAKGFSEGLGIDVSNVKSPTYTYLRKYEVLGRNIYHFDYYRLEEADNLVLQELDEIIHHPNAYVLIEWPEKIEHILPKPYIEIHFEVGENPNERIITIHHK
ncbi:tRNA (adenosine(37)-N6)-threonylcarbamoyltransferase complex ATPase subunit type 1 TsaE [Patescibacteria group bacterium]